MALVLTGLFVVGPLAGIFPFQQYLDVGEDLKASWEASSGTPPWGHAEESTLARFCQRMEDLERSDNQRLVAIDCAADARGGRGADSGHGDRGALPTAAGYDVDPDATFRDEASRLGTDPEGLIEAMNGKGGGVES